MKARPSHDWPCASDDSPSGASSAILVSEALTDHRSRMSQLSFLESTKPRWVEYDLPDADVRLMHGFMDGRSADALFQALRTSVRWRQDTIRIYGKEHPLPRLQQWFGDPGLDYTWSGIHMSPEPWPELLREAKRKVEEVARVQFNTVLLNLYRSGQDTVSWHADDEKDLGPTPTIASMSLGAERDFVLRHNEPTDLDSVTIALPHGSLLLMAGSTQSAWKHALPRRKTVAGERINLTFRRVIGTNQQRRRRT
jgi:alkylated DNA repair dioxygenase AlkB